MNNIIFKQILHPHKKKSLVEDFISFKMQHLQEMGYNSSLATARNYINFAEQRRKQKLDIWDEKVIDDIIMDVIKNGKGTDDRFLFNLTPQENESQDSSKAWLKNVMSYIQKGLSDIAPNSKVFETIENMFRSHLHRG
jgi:hypothetical protein